MSSESIPTVSKKRKWLEGRRERKTPGLIQSDLLKTGSVHPQNTDDIQYSGNWRTLSQTLGLSSGRRSIVHPKSRSSRARGQGSSTDPIVLTDDGAPPAASTVVGNCIALDCEMVGGGEKGRISMLARCSVVDHCGNVILDKYVAPTTQVTDYRTRWSGIRAYNLIGAPSFSRVQTEVAALLGGKTLVGHAIKNDLQALHLHHPKENVRDTSMYKPFREIFGGRNPSLKNLAKIFLNESIQKKEHNSVEDARATMKVYQLHKKDWEKSLTLSKHSV